MNAKVKRGLGLLAVAVGAWVVAYLTNGSDNAVVSLIGGLAVVVLVASVVVGLVLIAWGLATRGSGRRASDPPG